MMRNLNHIGQRNTFSKKLLLTFIIVVSLSACDVEDIGVANDESLPIGNSLTLFCPDAGINTSQCVLDDPENPFALMSFNNESKFTLFNELVSKGASHKTLFYLWATVLANEPSGENQYYTALELHELFSINPTNLILQQQAIDAYRSVLDNFYLSSTFVGPFTVDELFFAVFLKDLSAFNLITPDAPLFDLYPNNVAALADMSEWGYIYDEDLEVVNYRQ